MDMKSKKKGKEKPNEGKEKSQIKEKKSHKKDITTKEGQEKVKDEGASSLWMIVPHKTSLL